MNIRHFFLSLFLCCFMALPAHADELTTINTMSLKLGAGAGVMTSEYKGVNAKAYPLPIVNYEDDRFYIRGFTGGIKLYSDGIHEFSVTASYLPQSFDSSDSSSRAMKKLDDRNLTMMLGAAYRLQTQDFGGIQVEASADVLDKNDGFMVDAGYYYPIFLKRLSLVPSIGGVWTSSDYNDYYYGVSSRESRKSGLKRYKADGGISPYLGLKAQLEISENWDAFVNTKAVFLSEEITDSPMVNEDVKYSIGTGVTYSF